MSLPSSAYLIPLTNVPQSFEIVLAGVTYTLTCKWNDQPDACWILDIADASATPIASGLPLVTGVDLLDGLEYLGIAGSLYVGNSGSDPSAVPTYDNLGTDANLYFFPSVANG